MSKIWKTLILVFAALSVHAQMAHELLLLVNRNSQDSLKAANYFIEARKIPKSNVVYLDIPTAAYQGAATITPEEFSKLIWDPANALAKEREIDNQILAWVYSVDFPIRVKTDETDRKQMSVLGLTFLRDKVPGLGLVEEGKFLSRLFAGPNQRIKYNLQSLSLGVWKRGLGTDADVPSEAAYLQRGLGENMPLPSMMLGYTGEKGTDIQTVIDTIFRGKKSDHIGKKEGIYFIHSDDVRSKCRDWQFYPAVNELQNRKVTAVVTNDFPSDAENVMGLLMGAETVDPSTIKSFAPGAMAEHLTSWSAEFQKPQTKLTEWLKAGATVTAGTVVEPYSNANKFPSARYFVHYASGCTALESLYQSIACPLQSLLLGDPLAKPYAMPMQAFLMGVNTLERDFTYLAHARSPINDAEYLYSFYLDGKLIREESDDASFFAYVKKISDGYHTLRVVARLEGSVPFHAWAEKDIVVNLRDRSVVIRTDDVTRIDKHKHGLKIDIGGEELPERLKLVCGKLVLDEKDYAPDAELIMDELMIGEGPNNVCVIAVYADHMEVSSKPMVFGVEFAK